VLDAANPLKLMQDVVVVCDASADQALRDVFAASTDGDEAVATDGIAVPLKGRRGDNFIAHVLPLTSGARREAGLSSSAAAALFVRRASIDLAGAIEAASRLYGLTPAEVRVLQVLIESGGVSAVAETLGTSRSTVKRHLEHVFAKTGTRRQTELLKLFAGFESPASPAKQK
jgi:DNA-binding CsgD family transcriptional regulator